MFVLEMISLLIDTAAQKLTRQSDIQVIIFIAF